MIDRKHIGKTWPAYKVEVEKGRLRFFAKAIGERNPIYTDEAAARAAGYTSLPVPPTFLFSLENEGIDVVRRMEELGADIGKLLHAEQSFRYFKTVCAGETLQFESRISDISEKKGGALEFIVRDTTVKDSDGAPVAELRALIAMRNQ